MIAARHMRLTGVVCVFHDRHELDCVVAKVTYSRQRVGRKLLVCSNPEFGGGDPYMSFVDANARGGGRTGILEFVFF